MIEGTPLLRAGDGCDATGLTLPVAEYAPRPAAARSSAATSTAARRYPDLAGGYLFGDYCSGKIWGLDAAGPNGQTPVLLYDTGANMSRSARTGRATSTSSIATATSG